MVARAWNWDLAFMATQFGWKATLAVLLSTTTLTFRFRRELSALPWRAKNSHPRKTPMWMSLAHVGFLAAIVASAHHSNVFGGLFLLFLGFVKVTAEYQESLKFREGLLVALFLSGLVVLGGYQRWWLEPLITQLNSFSLFLAATGLTAVTDNAALTYLGAQVPTLSEVSRYALVAGAVTGGGLTVIANAPNPAGLDSKSSL